jgi:mannose-6-phosphate isomerase-like protein (cupin superfamily)
MTLQFHPVYQELVEKASRSHEKNRNPEGITAQDIQRARLYCYAFRRHTIGTFHATRQVLSARPDSVPAAAWRVRANEALADLANQAMETVPDDFRALIAAFFRYHLGVSRAIDSLQRDYLASHDAEVDAIARRFEESVSQITSDNGISLSRDDRVPVQAGYVVPNLGITIVPLVYGDHHSWNLAYLAGDKRDVPVHRHHFGVEIHLGFNPTHGRTVLGTHRADVDEGYAMPIPPETDHGWTNTGPDTHHVPFIFGSRKYGGWGVFLDVVAQTRPVEEYTTLVPRESSAFGQMVFLERAIAQAEKMTARWRTTLIPASVTNRNGVGGLELCLTRINTSGWTFPSDEFRAVSVVRGEGVVSMAGLDQAVSHHDHFAIPAGIPATMAQTGKAPLVVLDATIRGY